MKRALYLLAFALLGGIVFRPCPSRAYNQGPNDAHALILRQAVEILRADFGSEMADAVAPHVGEMIAGITNADDQYGRIYLELLSDDTANWNAAGNTHYYNPAAHHAQTGLKIGILHGTDSSIQFFYGWGIVVGASGAPGGGDYRRVFALRGPQPSADRLADYYYSGAVQAMRAGNASQAYYYLGHAVHMVMDSTVPHHAADSYGVLDLHRTYEENADLVARDGLFLATTGNPENPATTFYVPGVPLSAYVDSGARISREWLGEITEWWGIAHTYTAYEDVYARLVPLAQQLTAGVLHKFETEWATEPYSSLQLTVSRVAAHASPDPASRADLFVSLNVIEPGESASSYSYDFSTDDFVTGYIADSNANDLYSFLGYDVWQFPYTSETVRAGEEVTMVLALWDDDDIDGWTHSISGRPYTWYEPDWIDINPDSGYRLAVKVNMRTGDVSRAAGRAWVSIGQLGETITSAGSESGSGEIQFRVTGIYVPAAVPQAPHAPVNLSPGTIERPGRAIALQPQLFASVYSDPNGDAQADSEWEVSDAAGSVVFHAMGGPRIMQDVTTALAPGTTYRWRVRYRDATGAWSAWSTETSFETDRPPDRPANQTPPAGAEGQPLRPVLTASAYHDPESHLQGASEWEVGLMLVRDGAPVLLPIYSQLTGPATDHSVAEELDPSASYSWRVRYKDALGAWSEWSERTTFATALGAVQPGLPTVVPLIPTLAPLEPIPTLTVLTPNGGEILLAGSTSPVKWGWTGTRIAMVDVDFSTDGGSTWFSAGRGLPNSGSYAWSVPEGGSSACLVKVIGFDGTGARVAEDQSDKPFRIVPPTAPPVLPVKVQVLSPKAGETWAAGTHHDILWATSGEGIAYVEIYYSTDAGTSMRDVAHKEANDGRYDWLVPSTPSQAALVRVLAYNAKGEFLALGDSALFTIYGQ